MDLSRRNAIAGLMTAGIAAGTSACGKSTQSGSTETTASAHASALPHDIPHRMNGLLLNQAAAVREMEKAGVDLVISATPKNIYYLTNQQPVPFTLGLDGMSFATLSAYGDAKPTLIESQIGYYFTTPESSQKDLINIDFYSSPADPDVYGKILNARDLADAPAAPGLMPRRHNSHELSSLEAYRRSVSEKEATELTASIEAAILKQILDNPLKNKTIAIDHSKLRPIIEKSGLDVKIVDAENLIRRFRIEKTPMEIDLMRYAAAANASAGNACAKAARDGASFAEIRREFSKECATRALSPVFMMIDTIIPHFTHGEIIDGRTFLIDCVSEFEGYHGDYGRTVCVGEPKREIKAVIDTLSTTWDRIRSELRPGMTFYDLFGRSAELFKESNVDAGFAINPHTIGLNHSDEPMGGSFGQYRKENITLVENMVLSIDMPVLDSGLGGTAHLEDLVLITKDGAELLNQSDDRFITV